MPLGDSITFGVRDPGYGGYRHLLMSLLINDGYKIDFVGSQRIGNASANEGHPGWTIQQIKDGIDSKGWLETYKPDIILLHIGTNDIRQDNETSATVDLSGLLDDILKRLPNTHIIVAQIIPFRRGPERGHELFNNAIPEIAASKGPRVTIVDMRNILSRADYADGLHPNAGGYDKMAQAWEAKIHELLSASTLSQPATSKSKDIKPSSTASEKGEDQVPAIRYVPGSTSKLEQLIGDEDKEWHLPTISRTNMRYQIEGTDLGYSFNHQGRTYFLFGDTLGRLDRALDTIATTVAPDPEQGVRLDFLMVGDRYLTVEPPGISMGAFEVPVSGVSLNGQMYVVVSTNHSKDRTTDRSVLTKFIPPAEFRPLRTISQLPAGRFIKMSMREEPGPIQGLPPG